MSNGIEIGVVPAGALIIKLASVEDLREDTHRVVLVRKPGQQPEWLCTLKLEPQTFTLAIPS